MVSFAGARWPTHAITYIIAERALAILWSNYLTKGVFSVNVGRII